MEVIKYLTPFYEETSRDKIANSNIFSIAVKSSKGFGCSIGAKGSLENAETKTRELLKKYPECTIAKIRDCSQDSNRVYGPYGYC